MGVWLFEKAWEGGRESSMNGLMSWIRRTKLMYRLRSEYVRETLHNLYRPHSLESQSTAALIVRPRHAEEAIGGVDVMRRRAFRCLNVYCSCYFCLLPITI